MERTNINGFTVDISVKKEGAFLTLYEVKTAIIPFLNEGHRSGKLFLKGTILEWKVPFEKIKEGDIVVFSTSGKYNPGFHSTNTYRGVVEKVTENGEIKVKSDNGKIAFIKEWHVEHIIN